LFLRISFSLTERHQQILRLFVKDREKNRFSAVSSP
jgi:hypothetical protein